MGLMTWLAKSRDIAGNYCRKGETAQVSIAKLKSYALLSSFTKPARAAALVQADAHRLLPCPPHEKGMTSGSLEERQRPLGALGHRSTLRAELMVCFLQFKQFTKLDDFSMDSLFGTIVYAEFTQL